MDPGLGHLAVGGSAEPAFHSGVDAEAAGRVVGVGSARAWPFTLQILEHYKQVQGISRGGAETKSESPLRHHPQVPRRCDWRGPADSPGQSGSGSDSGLRRHNRKPPRHGWPTEFPSGFRSLGASDGPLRHHARFPQQPRQARMHLRWGIKSRHERLPPLWIQLEALAIGQGCGCAGQGAFQHELCHAALGRRGCSLQGLFCHWRQPQVQHLAAQGGRDHDSTALPST